MAIVKGLEIIDNTDKILDSLNTQIEEALIEVGEIAVEYAKNNTPVDTGNLKNSIDYSVNENVLNIGSDLEYAIYVEEGTRKIVGHHMLRDALSTHNSEYKDIIENHLKD